MAARRKAQADATKEAIIGLYRRAATELPRDVQDALARAAAQEESQIARDVLQTILKNTDLARAKAGPICQDTGTPIFYVSLPDGASQARIRQAIEEATVEATAQVPLRPNALEAISGRPLGNIAHIHFSEGPLKITLLLKGGGSENIGAVYSLPDERLGAERDLAGVRRCVLDAVVRAQGKGCPPYVIGVGIAGTIEQAMRLATMQLLRPLSQDGLPSASQGSKTTSKTNSITNKYITNIKKRIANDKNEPDLALFERELLAQINSLGIGPMGLGGKTTALGVHAAAAPRHPASFFVAVSFGCWALRRASHE